MKILYISHTYPPIISGVSVIAQKLAREMSNRGHDVSVITTSDTGKSYTETDRDVRLYKIRSIINPFWAKSRTPFTAHSEIETLIRKINPDIIHTHESVLLSIQSLKAAKRLKIPIIATTHYVPGFTKHYIKFSMPSEIVEQILWQYTKILFKKFDMVIFDTETQRKIYEQNGVQPKSSVISGGLDLNQYYYKTDRINEIYKKYKLPEGFKLLFVGRIAKDKKIDILIKSMKHIKNNGKIFLIIVGDGDESNNLKNLVEKLNLQSVVKFLGFVVEDDLPDLYSCCNVFSIASDCEVLSLPTLQALAVGMPVVAKNALALPELVEIGKTGFLVNEDNPADYAKYFDKFYENKDLIKKFKLNCLEKVKKHDNPKVFDENEKLYKELTGKKLY